MNLVGNKPGGDVIAAALDDAFRWLMIAPSHEGAALFSRLLEADRGIPRVMLAT